MLEETIKWRSEYKPEEIRWVSLYYVKKKEFSKSNILLYSFIPLIAFLGVLLVNVIICNHGEIFPSLPYFLERERERETGQEPDKKLLILFLYCSRLVDRLPT